MGAQSFTDLKVWQAAVGVAEVIYKGTEAFPPEERYGLSSQLRRAAVSIHGNIAEGFSRYLPRERARFYEIAKSSADELKSHLVLVRRVRFPPFPPDLDVRLDDVCKMLYSLRRAVLSDLK
jgi:four helix bundle protein